jgi:hypothetical protein
VFGRMVSHCWDALLPCNTIARAVNSALSCPSAACISLYSDRTASLKGTSLDAHYLSTSHSSGEYEARHSFVPCGGVAAR